MSLHAYRQACSICLHAYMNMCPYMSTYICHVSAHACCLYLHGQCMVGVSACTYACYMSTCAPATCACTYIYVLHCLHAHIYGLCVCIHMHVTLVHARYVYCIAYVSVYTYKLFVCVCTYMLHVSDMWQSCTLRGGALGEQGRQVPCKFSQPHYRGKASPLLGLCPLS